MRIGSAADLALERGTFISPESGARGANVHPSDEYTPDVRSEEDRVSGRDPLRKRRLSIQRFRSPFPQIERDWRGRQRKSRLDLACWPMTSVGVELDEIADSAPFDPVDIAEAYDKELASLDD